MSGWRGIRVLVTGGAGFVGANLVRDLVACGAEVHCILRPSTQTWRLQGIDEQISFHIADLSDPDRLDTAVVAANPRIAFHLAAEGGHPTERDVRLQAIRSTVGGTVNLLEALREVGLEKLVHAGSLTEYGPKDRPVRETDPPMPTLFRGASKAGATHFVGQFAAQEGRSALTLRLPAVFGPWEQSGRFVPTLALAALQDRVLELTPRSVSRDYCFVEDVVEAFRLAADVDGRLSNDLAGEIINIGTGRQVTNVEMARLAGDIVGRELKTRIGAYQVRDVDRGIPPVDAAKAHRLLGWSPRHTLRQGLKLTLGWFRNHLDAYV